MVFSSRGCFFRGRRRGPRYLLGTLLNKLANSLIANRLSLYNGFIRKCLQIYFSLPEMRFSRGIRLALFHFALWNKASLKPEDFS